LAHGPILLLGNAVYWDDWTLLGAPKTDILDEFRQAGSFLNYVGWVHVVFSYLNPWSYKLATFICTYLAGFFLYKILIRDVVICSSASYWITLLFLTTPLYIARVASIDFIYTLSVFIFLLGWWYLKVSKPLAIIFFAISFNTQSLLIFYALPITIFLWQRSEQGRDFRFLLRHLDLIILPFLWFILKVVYFEPYGTYFGYNSNIHVGNILPSAVGQFADFINFWNFLLSSKVSIEVAIVAALILSFCYLFSIKSSGYRLSVKTNIELAILGFMALLLGLIPYWVVSHVPTFFEWTSRHQLLMPFGVAFIIIALANILNPFFQRGALLAFIAVSILLNSHNYRELYFDWNKQKLIINGLSKMELAKNARLLIFDDRTKNALRRQYRNYEWNGLINQAFPGEYNRIGLGISQFEDYNKGAFDKGLHRYYHTRSYRKAKVHETILISIIQDGETVVLSASYI
jgi:hypothetical protein